MCTRCAPTPTAFRCSGLNYSRPVPSNIVEIFGDSDPAKWIEAVGYSLATHPDPALEALVDKEIARIVARRSPMATSTRTSRRCSRR